MEDHGLYEKSSGYVSMGALAPKLIRNKVISDTIWEALSNPNESPAKIFKEPRPSKYNLVKLKTRDFLNVSL